MKKGSAQSPATPTADTPATPPEKETRSTESPSAAESATPDSPEANATQQPEAKPEDAKGEEADDVLSTDSQKQEDKDSPEYVEDLKARFQKRIGNVTARAKAAEGQIEQLKAQLAQLTQQNAKPEVASLPLPSKAPLPDIKDANALKEYRQSAKQTIRSVDEALDRDDIDWSRGEVTIPELFGNTPVTKAMLKGARRGAQTALEDTIPAQEEYFKQQAQWDQQRRVISQNAAKAFPDIADANLPEVKKARTFFQQNMPEVLNHPASDWVIGAYIRGVKAYLEDSQAAKAKEEPKKEAAKEPAKAVVKPRPPSDQTAVSTAGSPQRVTPNQGRGPLIPRGNQNARSAAEFLVAAERARRGQ